MNQTGKKRILLVITKSNFGGAQRYVFEIASTLKKRGFEVAVASGGTEGMLIEKCQQLNIKHLSLTNLDRDMGLLKEIKAIFSLSSTIRKFKPDIIHLNSSKAGGLGALVSRFLGVPTIIFTAHGWPFREDKSKLWKILIWILSFCTGILAHKIIVVSKKDYDDCPSKLVRKKASIIYTGVPHFSMLDRHTARQSLHSETTISQNKKHIWLVSIAELTPNKNIAYAISTVAEFNRNNTCKYFYSIIGDGEERSKIQKLIEKENAKNEIKLCGFLDDARKYLPAFDVFLLPSKKEGMPYALFEAGMARLPLIASNTGGIPEFVTNAENGLLIDPRKQSTLTKALHYYCDESNRKESGDRAYDSTCNFSIENMLNKTLKIYNLNSATEN